MKHLRIPERRKSVSTIQRGCTDIVRLDLQTDGLDARGQFIVQAAEKATADPKPLICGAHLQLVQPCCKTACVLREIVENERISCDTLIRLGYGQ